MTNAAQERPRTIVWDFDGTILPFDSEQALLKSLSRSPQQKVGRLKARWGRWLAWADNNGYLARSFKHWYVRCLRGLPVEELDALARQLAPHISDLDRQAIQSAHNLGLRMTIVSCGTGDMSQRILAAAGLTDCFDDLEANWFTFWAHQIEGMDLAIHLAEDKVETAERLGIDLDHAIAVGDGMTDVPLLDRVRYPILLDRNGERRDLVAAKRYSLARSLPEAARMIQDIVKSSRKEDRVP